MCRGGMCAVMGLFRDSEELAATTGGIDMESCRISEGLVALTDAPSGDPGRETGEPARAWVVRGDAFRDPGEAARAWGILVGDPEREPEGDSARFARGEGARLCALASSKNSSKAGGMEASSKDDDGVASNPA